MPPKIRDLEAALKRNGFLRESAKGSHRKWTHASGKYVVMSGHEGHDAKRYQIKDVEEAVASVKSSKA